jgi:predicted AAA+ superfamily ATPase
MLLYGEAGTGKSATVKNLLNLEGFGDLRIIEIDKEQLSDMPELIRTLGGRRQKFILFIDDLSFESAEGGYSVLKTVLEGGLEKRPDNVVIYATSNRRHLMRETFSERGGDEVNLHETIQERTALSERFGIRVLFVGLNQDDYLALVEKLAAQAGIEKPREQLWKEAIQWEREHASRTPRAAQQFVDYLRSK